MRFKHIFFTLVCGVLTFDVHAQLLTAPVSKPAETPVPQERLNPPVLEEAPIINNELAISQSASNSDALEITAKGYLEWQRSKNMFIAKDSVIAKQGDTSIQSDQLQAKYDEQSGGKGMALDVVTATGNVLINSNGSTAAGDRAFYDVTQSYAEMTGDGLKMVSKDQTLTARDQFEYWVDQGKLIATSNVVVIRPKPTGGQDVLKADKMTAILTQGIDGKRELKTLEATGNVTITTPTETVSGSYAIYRAGSNTAEMKGGVTINRGPNVLQGSRATVNLNTNISQIFGGATSTSGDGRVRGVFYPKSQ